MIGKIISHYKILEQIGSGGMGIIYKSHDFKLDRLVALKFLPPAMSLNEEVKQRFIREAKAASSLQHQNICTIHEIDETREEQLFICMDFYEGSTLRQKIKSGFLDIESAVDISIQVSQGLSTANEKGIIHRDIKPANIFITNDGVVKILDFGLAKSDTYEQITRMDSTKGTIAYISPEQAKGKEATHQSDIWSLGVVMYEMLTGSLPFKGNIDQVIIYSILDKEPERITSFRPDIPLELENIVSKALEKNLDSRYQNIEEMLADLVNFKNKSSDFNNYQFIRKRKGKSNRIKTAFISALIVIVASVILYFIKPNLFGGFKNDIPISIAVIGFDNQTGDSSYNYLQKAIPNLLITNLEQAEYLHVTTWERMHDLLKKSGKEEVEEIDNDLAFELCRLDGIDAIVLGSFVKAGDVFVTDVKVLDASSKKLLRSTNIKSEGVQSILESQIDYLSNEIAEGIGLSAREIESVQLRIADVSTNSIEAYNNFLQGREDFEKRYFDDSRKFLEKSIELDSTYAVAYLYLAWVYDNLKYIEKEFKAYQKAKIFSKKATEKERLYIEASYAERIENLPEKKFSILQQMIRRFPREKRVYVSLGSYYRNKLIYKEAILNYNKAIELDPEFGQAINLLAYTYSDMKNYEKAIEYFKRYTSIFPGDADPFEAMGDLYFKLGELDKALQSFEKALEIRSDFGSGLRIAYIFALKENYAEAIKWLDHYISTIPSPIQAYGYIWKGIYHMFLGNYKQSLNDISMMQEIMKSVGNEEKITTGIMFKGMIYFDMGEYEKSKTCTKVFYNVAKKNQNLINYFGATEFLAVFDLMEGKIDSAKLKITECDSLLVKLLEVNPYKANVLKISLNIFYMELLMVEGDFEGAISVGENLDKTLRADFEIEGLVIYNSPFIQDALARAYYYNGEPDKAIAEYERLITFDSTSNNRRLIHPKYHYLLAKLYQEKGLKQKAISEFEKFLELWKNADKGIAQLIDAKSQLAMLVIN